MSRRTRVLFLVNSLAAGGAERQLCELARNLDPAKFEIHVAVTYDPGCNNGGELWDDMASIPGVQIHSLHKKRGAIHHLQAFPRLLALVRKTAPDILHGYTDGNLPILLAGAIFRKPIVWGIRRSSADMTTLDRKSIRFLRILVRLSPFADLAIFNSECGLKTHTAMGMKCPQMRVVPNGFDTGKFTPTQVLGAAMRQEWRIPETAPLIGIVGRLHPVKDHPTFLRMAARVAGQWPEARFICIGKGPESYRRQLQSEAERLGIGDRVLWPGVCREMTAAYNALSMMVLTSTDEGFPNVIGEAMACGIPCVSTDVGDAAFLVGETGIVTAPGDDQGLAHGVDLLLREAPDARVARSAACRSRICESFSAAALARNTERALLTLVRDVAQARPFTDPPSKIQPSQP